MSKYGDFNAHANLHCGLMDLLANYGYSSLRPQHSTALSQILFKVAGLVTGDTDNSETWADIAAYAKRGEESCINNDPRQGVFPISTDPSSFEKATEPVPRAVPLWGSPVMQEVTTGAVSLHCTRHPHVLLSPRHDCPICRHEASPASG